MTLKQPSNLMKKYIVIPMTMIHIIKRMKVIIKEVIGVMKLMMMKTNL